MEKPISFGELDFRIVASMERAQSKPDPETPFRICIMGDFSGRENRKLYESVSAPSENRPIEVDRDNIESVMEKLGVEVQIPLAGVSQPPVAIQFTELDDFHPEQIYARLDVFKALRDTRKKLSDPSTFESTKKEVQGWAGEIVSPGPSETVLEHSTPPPTPPEPPAGSILDQIVDQSEGPIPDAGTMAAPSDWDDFLHKIVGPHLVPGEDPEQERLVAAVDASISGLMNAVLHDSGFQSLEAAWRALRFLVSRAETDERLRIYLLDLSKQDLIEDLESSDDLRSTGLYRIFVEHAKGTLGGDPWALLAGDYTFDKTRRDIQALGRMARIAAVADASFVSAANTRFLGCDSLAEATPNPDDWSNPFDDETDEDWKALRSLKEASYLGLALPRFLLRLPYGADTDPVDYFDFEEMPGAPVHEHYLWGNPAFACALLLARAFSHKGWDLRPSMMQDLEGLPLHIYKDQGETIIKPCAEVVLTEKAMEKILEFGLMVLLSFKSQDKIRLARFQSVSDPARNLTGPWDH